MSSLKYQRPWRDTGGVNHDPADAPKRQRIVSLVPSLTETLCAVGAQNKLVGCTAFCIKPAGLLKDSSIVKVGGTKTIMRDKLLALKPDLILLNLEENTLEDIDFLKARVECYINGVKTVEQGIETLREIGSLTGTLDVAGSLAGEIENTLEKIRARVRERMAAANTAPRIFYPIWRDPWMTINADTFIDNHIAACGGINVFSHFPARYPVVTADEIRAAAPDIVWLPSEPYIFKSKHADEMRNLLGAPGAQTPRVELVDGDNICWFGARQNEGLAYTFRQLWGADPIK